MELLASTLADYILWEKFLAIAYLEKTNQAWHVSNGHSYLHSRITTQMEEALTSYIPHIFLLIIYNYSALKDSISNH